MTEEQKREKLLQHPDTLEVEIGGETRPWLIGKYAMDLAKKRGVKLQDVLGGDDDDEEEDAEEGFERVCKLLWFGFLPFEPEVEQGDFDFLLSFGDIGRLTPVLMGSFGEFLEEEVEQKKRSAQGKADRKKGRS